MLFSKELDVKDIDVLIDFILFVGMCSYLKIVVEKNIVMVIGIMGFN